MFVKFNTLRNGPHPPEKDTHAYTHVHVSTHTCIRFTIIPNYSNMQ